VSCCEPLDHDSPYSRIIGWGWYDGLTEGLASCDRHGQAFAFHLLSRDFADDEQFVYGLAAIRAAAFDEAIQVLGAAGLTPAWPVWIPRWTFATADQQLALEKELRDLRIEGGSIQCIALTRDLSKSIIAARSVSDQQHREIATFAAIGVPFQKWVNYVLARE
jgi:hypothetical protein